MSVKKRSTAHPSETGKMDVYRDAEERVLSGAPQNRADSGGLPVESIIEAALKASNTGLLRAIAGERRGLTDKQRQALLLVADILDRPKR